MQLDFAIGSEYSVVRLASMSSPIWGSHSQRITLACVVATLALSTPPSADTTHAALAGFPRLVLWAWERPEDLRTLAPDLGVAFLAQTITARDDGFSVEPRRQPLRVTTSTPLVAVTRIEAGRSLSRPLSSPEARDFASLIARTATRPQVIGVQIDFDATRSQRSFYRELLGNLRGRLGSRVPISMTALASWCVDDRWLQGLPVDEIVPALFRMGPTNQPFRDIGESGAWTDKECRRAIGTSLDEPVVQRSANRRVYVFAPKPWTAASIAEARRITP